MSAGTPDPSKPSGLKLKGFSMVHLLNVLERRHGPQMVKDFAATLPDPFRAMVANKMVLPISWQPVELYGAAVHYEVNTFFHGDPKAAMALGKEIATEEIGRFFKMVLKLASPPMVMGLTGHFWRDYYDGGTLAVKLRAPGDAIVTVSGWPLTSPISLHEMGGAFLAWCEASRGKNVRIDRIAETTPGVIEYGLRFD